MFSPMTIFVTTKNKTEAETIAKTLLQKKLIACANMIDHVRSLYWWGDKIQDEQEVMLILKSEQSLFEKVESVIKSIHSYEVPEIIALPVVASHTGYVQWMKEFLLR